MVDGKTLGIENKARKKLGYRVLSPPGGGYHCSPGAREELEKLIEADFTSKDPLDLRFNIKRKYLPVFRDWWYNRKGREINPMRELKEELIDEVPILNNPEVSFGEGICAEVYWNTLNSKDNKQKTYSFYELFPTHLDEKSNELLIEASLDPEIDVKLFSKKEMLDGTTLDDIKIAGDLFSLMFNDVEFIGIKPEIIKKGISPHRINGTNYNET